MIHKKYVLLKSFRLENKNADNQHFFPFLTRSSIFAKTNFNFSVTLILFSTNVMNSDQCIILSFAKELKQDEFLILLQMTNYRLFRTERVCRRQLEIL